MTATIVSVVTLAVVAGLALWVRSYLSGYLGEKGKNLATKEDMAELTHKVEGVRMQYQRAGAATQAQFEAEFRTYEEIWGCLIDVQRAALSLRPMVDVGLRQGETQEQRQEQRLTEFAEAFNRFTSTYMKRRPFYPDAVFSELGSLAGLAHGEAVDYQYGEPRLDRDYWRQARDNAQRISNQVDRICTVIRARLASLSAA